jgi:NADPH2:quinone reductase
MRAAYIEHIGPPEVILLGDLPKPEAGPGQALVRVRAVALNPIDLYLRSGMVAMPIPLPYIIGCDLAGIVEAVGEGVSRVKLGDRVWASNQGLMGRQGVAAEYASVDEHWLYPTPDSVSDVEMASLALTGITAHLGLFQFGRMARGETVYVAGGTGGVGSLVIQMAKAAGAARVMTTAGSPERAELCLGLGADLALNYKTDDIAARLKEFAPEGIDVWFETQREPNLEMAIPLLRKRGRMLVIAGRQAKPTLPLGSFYPRDCSLIGFAMFNASPEEQARAAAEINRWVETGQLKPQVGRTFPLTDAAQAERFLEENTVQGAGTLTGKVVLTID